MMRYTAVVVIAAPLDRCDQPDRHAAGIGSSVIVDPLPPGVAATR
jgi:hypothetical protein